VFVDIIVLIIALVKEFVRNSIGYVSRTDIGAKQCKQI